MTDELGNGNRPADEPPRPIRYPSFIERQGIHPLVYALIVLVVIFFTYQIIGSIITLIIFKSAAVTRENVQGIRLETLLGQVFLLLGPTIILARLQTRDLRSLFRLKVPSLKSTVYAFVGLVSLQQMAEVYLYFQDKIPIPPSIRPMIDEYRKMIEDIYTTMIASHSPAELLFVITVVALVPAVCEELLFRGLVQDNVERGSPKPWMGFVITGAIFGFYHLNPFALIPLIALGMYFGYIVYYSRSILIAMAAHFVNNALAVLAAYYSINDDIVSTLAAGPATMPKVLASLGFFTILFAVSLYGFRRSIQNSGGITSSGTLVSHEESEVSGQSDSNVKKEG